MKFLKYLLTYAVLVCLQVFFLKRMWSGLYVSVYIALLLLMDIRIPRWQILLSGFAMGGIMDLITPQPGINAAVCGVLAMCRDSVLRLTIPNDALETKTSVLTSNVPVKSFFVYVSIMVGIWSVLFFVLDAGFSSPLILVERILFNMISATVLIYLLQLPFKY